jgi:hypothetical protein
MKKRRKPPNPNHSNLDGTTPLPRISVLTAYRKTRKLVKKFLRPIRVIQAIICSFRVIYGLLRLFPKFTDFCETMLQTLPWF